MKYIVTLLVIFSSNAYAIKEHPIDLTMSQCLQNKANRTTAGMSQCVNKATIEWDKELNRVYKLLQAELSEEGKEALLLSQRQWLKQRDLEFKFLEKMYSRQRFSGSMYSNMQNMDVLNVVKSRVLTLTKYLNKH